MRSTENEQDVNAHEPKVIITDRESDIMPVIDEVHIDQNVLAKLTELIKDEDVVSRTKEKFNAKSNPILRNISNKISHLDLKKIWVEITRAAMIIDDPKNKYGHYMRTSHGLPCSCELITQFNHMFPFQLVDIEAFWRTLEIGSFHTTSSEKDMDMDSEMRSLTDLLHQLSTGPISKNLERCVVLLKGF
ncbi:hypothetical protein M9H77_04185 [Catharanthus roseus]|uniref:Uncharacterized protein n=1 Tax=Catharanthus roseus TaxID=4058 RepID=A0ACC0CDC2_CATRO|nr:hypothetical protein M9H77_04185 [Catharanthus roseus]